jgi:formate dehydrogenase subunit gamma
MGLEDSLQGDDRDLTGRRRTALSVAPSGLFQGAEQQGGRGMAKLLAHARLIIGALALVFVVAVAAPAPAQQPSSVNPTASAVKEDQLLQQLKIINGRGTIPDTRSYNLEQPGGRGWQQFHQVTLPWIGAIAILGILAVLVVFYLVRGMVKIESGRSGRTIVRFNAFERFVHWTTATCFIILALTGLNVTFGKKLLLPLMNPDAFSAWSQWGKYAHNYLSFPFTLGVIAIFLIWLVGNIPDRTDVEWLKRGGGIVGHDHPPASRFNAGQKAIYWIVVLGGVAIAASGYILMFPFYGTDVTNMQWAEITHGIIAMLFIAAMLGHIYIGTIGMEGAFEAMGTGTVDVNWAKEHHALWLSEEQARVGPNQSESQARAAATPAE